MTRRRLGTGLRRVISLSLSEEAIARLEEIGPSRSSAAEALILGASAPLKVVGVEAQEEELQRGCPHPKADEVKHAWGTQCGLCKKRLR